MFYDIETNELFDEDMEGNVSNLRKLKQAQVEIPVELIRSLVIGWREAANGDYCRTYNTGMGDGFRQAAKALEGILVDHLELGRD